MRKLFIYLFITYLLVLLTLLCIPTDQTGIKLNFLIFGIISDHYIHAILFLPFLVFCRILFKPSNWMIHFFIGIAFCSFCEGLHYFIPYREFSIQDFYANVTGISLGALSYKLRLFSKF